MKIPAAKLPPPETRRQTLVHLAALLFIGLAVFAVYSNTFDSPFVFDDYIYITENPKLADLSNFWPPSGTRYVAYLSFALNYSANGLDVFGWHLVNTAVHFVNSALVYFLALGLIKSLRPQEASEETDGRGPLKTTLPLCAALLFAVHPVQTEAVTYITQRFASLAATFYLLSVVLYLWWTKIGTATIFPRGKPGENSRCPYFRPYFPKALYAASLVSAVLAMKTKEISFTLPVVIGFLELTLSGWNRRIETIKRLLPFALTMLIIPLTLLFDLSGAGGVAERISRQQVFELEKLSRWSYLITQFRVLVKYLRLMVFPANQNLLYEYPLFDSLLVPEVFLSLIFLLIVFGLCVYLYIRASKKNDALMQLASLGGLWFFVTISVESSIVPIQDAMFEHRLYLPMAGASLAFTSAVFRLAPARRGIAVATAVIAFAVAPLGIAAYKRNSVWASEFSVWTDVVSKSPHSSLARLNLGAEFQKLGYRDKAVLEFKEAIRLDERNYIAMNNLGIAYRELGMLDEAVEAFRAAVGQRPNGGNLRYNLGLAYAAKGMWEEAIEEYRAALILKSDLNDAHFVMAEALEELGLLEDAEESYTLFAEAAPPEYGPYKEKAMERLRAIRARKRMPRR